MVKRSVLKLIKTACGYEPVEQTGKSTIHFSPCFKKKSDAQKRRLRSEGEEVEEKENGLETLFWETLLTLDAASMLAGILKYHMRGSDANA